MAALVAQLPTLPALDQALNNLDFQASRTLYNSLKDDGDQPEVADEHIKNIAALFVRQNAEKAFGIHLIHGHFQIPEGSVMVGTNFEDPAMRWARITDIATLDASSLHGHIFVLMESGYRAYEFQHGPLPDLTGVGEKFLQEFSQYLTDNGLTGLIGLQVLGCGDANGHGMSELILEDGTVMVDSSITRGVTVSRITGWRFQASHEGPRACNGGESHALMQNGNHKVFISGKPLPELKNVDDLKAALVEAGVI